MARNGLLFLTFYFDFLISLPRRFGYECCLSSSSLLSFMLGCSSPYFVSLSLKSLTS